MDAIPPPPKNIARTFALNSRKGSQVGTLARSTAHPAAPRNSRSFSQKVRRGQRFCSAFLPLLVFLLEDSFVEIWRDGDVRKVCQPSCSALECP
eukprot:754515-Amphidinium_carterae.1